MIVRLPNHGWLSLFPLLLCLLGCNDMGDYTSGLRGVAVDKDTGTAIQGVKVMSDGNSLAITGGDGSYLACVGYGTPHRRITFMRLGYDAITVQFPEDVVMRDGRNKNLYIYNPVLRRSD